MKKFLLFLAFIGVAAGLHSAALPDSTKQELIQDFSGGLNTSIPSHKLPTNFSPYMRNVFIDDGKIERINGYVTLGSTRTLLKVTGIFPFVRETGQTSFLVTDSSITLETSDFKSWIFVSSGSNSGSLLYWMQVRNKMWGFNGLDFPITWDGIVKTILNGSNGTPNVPKFRYGAYYQDRVWGFSIPNGASDLYFSAVIATDNVIIAPDDARAWPTNFATYVGRGDGTIGTGLWIYQGLLRAGKEQSIYTIYGDNPSAYQPRKEEASVGVASYETVRVMDGESHFLGQNGIYRNVKRISDLIEPDVTAMNRGISSIVTNAWESQADFSRGQFTYGSTATGAGFVTVAVSSFVMNYSTYSSAGQLPITSSFTIPAGGTTAFGIRIPTETVPVNFAGHNTIAGVLSRIWVKCECGVRPSDNFDITAEIKNLKTGQTATSLASGIGADAVNYGQVQFYGNENQSNVVFTADEINTGQFAIRLTVGLGQTNAADLLSVFSATGTGFTNIVLKPETIASYTSDVSTAIMVTAWGVFDSVNNTNGGSINFYYRTSTSAVNITTQTWQSINPGVTLSAPTINNYFQWTSTLNFSGPTSPAIDNVTISHVEGQGTDARAFAVDWLNRYWLTVTTTSNSTQRITYVKSRNTNSNPDAWMPVDGYPIDCYAKAGNVLYGGSASTGSVYRLDYGTNFDGVAINSIYDTPDLPLDNYFFDKYVYKYLIDGDKSIGGTMTIGSSVNEGTFTSSTFSISGVGQYLRIVEGVTKPIKTLRLRLQNNEKDIGLGINNVNVLYDATKALSNK